MIEKIPDQIPVQTGEWRGTTFDIIPKKTFGMACRKINELVDAVNELQTKVNKMAQNLNFAQPEVKGNVQDKFAEQRKWIGKLCWFWDTVPEEKIVDVLSHIDTNGAYPYVMCDHQVHYKNCEPVKPDDDIIYKGE